MNGYIFIILHSRYYLLHLKPNFAFHGHSGRDEVSQASHHGAIIGHNYGAA